MACMCLVLSAQLNARLSRISRALAPAFNSARANLAHQQTHRIRLKDLFGNEQWVIAERPIIQDANLYPIFKPIDYDNYAENIVTRTKYALKLRMEGMRDDFGKTSLRAQQIYYAAAENNLAALEWYLKNTDPTIAEIERPLFDLQINDDTCALIKRTAWEKRVQQMIEANDQFFD